MIPEIRIQYSWLLAGGPSKVLEEKYAHKPVKQYTSADYETWTENYRKAWQTHEQQILHGMCDVLGLEFRKPIIDVGVAPWFRAISDPLILNFRTEPDQFIDLLTHELFHVLLTDNNVLTIQNKSHGEVNLLGMWKKMFGDEHNFTVLAHIPVHAGSKYIYLDVLKEPKRLERDKQDVAKWPDYKAAWNYVEAHDYKDILKKLKESYQNYEAK